MRGPEDEGGDGAELERDGEGKLCTSFDGSLANRLATSSAAALARWRLWSRFQEQIAEWAVNKYESRASREDRSTGLLVALCTLVIGPPRKGPGCLVPSLAILCDRFKENGILLRDPTAYTAYREEEWLAKGFILTFPGI